MIRARTSLRDRGFQMLGIGQHSQGDRTLSPSDSPPDPADDSPTGSGGQTTLQRTSGAHRARSGPEAGESGLRHIWEIENLLGAEAETAVGRDAAAAPAAIEPEPLSTTEWIAPLPMAEFRPLPAPPPMAMIETAVAPTFAVPSVVLEVPPPPPLPAIAPAPPPPVVPFVSPPALDLPRVVRLPEVEKPEASKPLPAVAPGGDTPVTRPLTAPRGVPLTDEQQANLLQRADVQEKLVELNRAVQAEYDRILRDNISANRDITDWCHDRLAEARGIVTYRELGRLAHAEWCVQQVRARLDRAEQSTEQVRAPVLITLWGILWFFPFVYLIFNPTWVLIPLGLAGMSDAFIRPEVFLRALFFGGLGGVAAVFYHLFKYVRDRNFDGQYVLSYFGKPFMGMILGALAYLMVFAAMRVLGLTPVGLAGSESEALTHVLYMALLYVGALSIGFKENQTFNLLNRVIKRLLGSEEGGSQARVN